MKSIITVALVLMSVSSAFAQLSGTKTVGGTSPDYPTIRDALNAVSLQGVAAPGVTFTIRGGVYNEDSLVIRTATAKASAPITVKPASGATVVINVVLQSYANRAAILIDSTQYVTIDGSNAGTTSRNMSISALGVIGARGVRVINGSLNATIKNCIVRTGWSPATDSTIYRGIEVSVSGSGTNCHNALIDNNLVRNAGAGIMVNGVSNTDSLLGLVIRNNVVDSVSCRGIYTFQGIMGSRIYNNDIAVNVGQVQANFNLYGIYLGGGCDLCRVYNNKLHDMDIAYTGATANYGIAAILGTSNQNHGGNVIYNNFVAMNITKSEGTGSIYPLYSEETIADTLIYNTVKLTGSSASSRRTNAYYNGVTRGSSVIKNNILINVRTDANSQACAIGRSSAATIPVITSDYNDLYVGTDLTSHKIGSFTNVTYFATLTDWQANGYDGASISEDVQFVSATDLHIKPGVATKLKGGGTPIPGYTTDIDGQPRNVNTPDIGADEFSGTTGIEQVESVAPTSFALEQNYPNPFNPSTNIRFSVDVTKVVSLKVRDILGREVATLVDDSLAPGTYTVKWDATSFPSGVYFYTVRAGSSFETRRMILTK
jgi:hypothetical protein